MISRLILVVLLIAGGVFWLVASHVLDAPPGRTLPAVELDHSRPKPQGGFYRCPVEEPNSLNPFTSGGAVLRYYVLAFTHDALLEHDPATGELRPALAAALPEISANGDAPVYTFELRENLKFADGRPLTLDDVEFTVAAAQSADLQVGELAHMIESVRKFERLGERRFRIELDHFHYSGLVDLATQFRIVQRAWFEQRIAEIAAQFEIPTPAVGTTEFSRCLAKIRLAGPATGPYQLRDGAASWRPGDSLTLTQNPNCWRRTVYPECWNLAGIQLLFDKQLSGSVVAALNEQIDYLLHPDLQRVLADHARLRANYRLEAYDKLQSQFTLVIWNCKQPPFDNPAVRRALTALFDRQMLLERLHSNAGHVAVSWFPPGSLDAAPDLEPIPFEPEAAREVLAAAGCERVELLTPNDTELFRRLTRLVRSAFESAGVELAVHSESWRQIYPKLQSGQFAGGVLAVQAHSAVIDPGARFHTEESARFGGYSNPELDALFDRATAEPDVNVRRPLFQEISRVLHRDQPVTLLNYLSVQVLIHRRFQNVTPTKLGLFPERWWVEPTANTPD